MESSLRNVVVRAVTALGGGSAEQAVMMDIESMISRKKMFTVASDVVVDIC
ncbi:MAG: hypothetical protein HGB29_10185 [Chlorobiaceae bacterium]|nr:hypothetical protein [Chlorobiaceae bacterium]NTW75218.1 hypothetical protein [Chlorobiaceae bacterium]